MYPFNGVLVNFPCKRSRNWCAAHSSAWINTIDPLKSVLNICSRLRVLPLPALLLIAIHILISLHWSKTNFTVLKFFTFSTVTQSLSLYPSAFAIFLSKEAVSAPYLPPSHKLNAAVLIPHLSATLAWLPNRVIQSCACFINPFLFMMYRLKFV